jgi:hypothetical protein
MKDASDEEEGDDSQEHLYLDQMTKPSISNHDKKTRKQREEELRKMMDDDGTPLVNTLISQTT